MFWWRVVLSCHCWFYPKECNSGGGSWHKSSVFVYQLEFFSELWVFIYLWSQWIVRNAVQRRVSRGREPAVSIKFAVLTIFSKRLASFGPPGAGCKVIVLLNLLVPIHTNAHCQLKRKNCKLPQMGVHSQLPTALILQTWPTVQIFTPMILKKIKRDKFQIPSWFIWPTWQCNRLKWW